jgi:hypothetical protein
MHIPTAVLPSVANADLDTASATKQIVTVENVLSDGAISGLTAESSEPLFYLVTFVWKSFQLVEQ